MMYLCRCLIYFLLFGSLLAQEPSEWTHRVRIAGHGLTPENADSIVQSATETNVYGIEVDNDITGRYDSFLDPAEKLKAITDLTAAAHATGNHAFVYIAGLECITSDADEKEHTFFKDHPDWVQRDAEGRPAVFGGGTAFWIREGDEDVWISPYAVEWRKIYMARVREIAATGIDGIYVDIPYWMTHFEGWENTWASFDQYTLDAFRERTGYDALDDMDRGDFSDPVFRKWIDFRIATITEFMAEIRSEARSVNPACQVIAEIYPGIDESAVRVGADVYALYPVVDAICHEYSEGAYMAAGRSPIDWLRYMAGMFSFRAFAADKPTWMLSYSWNGNDKVKPGDAMQNLFAAQTTAGANSWDARGEVMSGTNDSGTRRGVYNWIEANQDILYAQRKSIAPIGVYFSDRTRNYFPEAFYKNYMGILLYLMQTHRDFQIVTGRNWDTFSGGIMVLPGVREYDQSEMKKFEAYVRSGRKLYWTGMDELDEEFMPESLAANDNFTGIEDDVFTDHYDELMAHAGESSDPELTDLFSEWFGASGGVDVKAPPFVVSQVAEIAGKPVVFLCNFTGLVPDEVGNPILQRKIEIRLPADDISKAFLVPFMQEEQPLKISKEGDQVSTMVPWLLRAAIVRFE